jgi:hypothetical protein
MHRKLTALSLRAQTAPSLFEGMIGMSAVSFDRSPVRKPPDRAADGGRDATGILIRRHRPARETGCLHVSGQAKVLAGVSAGPHLRDSRVSTPRGLPLDQKKRRVSNGLRGVTDFSHRWR